MGLVNFSKSKNLTAALSESAANPDTIYFTSDTKDIVLGGSRYCMTDISGKQDKITTSNKLPYSLVSDTPTIPAVNNPAITITQGGVSKGTFSLNQSSAQTIALDAGGSGDTSGLDSRISAVEEKTTGVNFNSGLTRVTSYDGNSVELTCESGGDVLSGLRLGPESLLVTGMTGSMEATIDGDLVVRGEIYYQSGRIKTPLRTIISDEINSAIISTINANY